MLIPLMVRMPWNLITFVGRPDNTYKGIEPVLNLNWCEGTASIIFVALVTVEIFIILIYRIKAESVSNPTDVAIIIYWTEPSRNSNPPLPNTIASPSTPTIRKLISSCHVLDGSNESVM